MQVYIVVVSAKFVILISSRVTYLFFSSSLLPVGFIVITIILSKSGSFPFSLSSLAHILQDQSNWRSSGGGAS